MAKRKTKAQKIEQYKRMIEDGDIELAAAFAQDHGLDAE